MALRVRGVCTRSRHPKWSCPGCEARLCCAAITAAFWRRSTCPAAFHCPMAKMQVAIAPHLPAEGGTDVPDNGLCDGGGAVRGGLALRGRRIDGPWRRGGPAHEPLDDVQAGRLAGARAAVHPVRA